jgi:TonB family protein
VRAFALLFVLSSTVPQAPPPPPAPPPPFEGSGATTSPASFGAPHRCDESHYPIGALQTGAEGATTLTFRITAEGTVRDIAVLQSSGSLDLDTASIGCAKEWRYRPATKNNAPIEVSWQAEVMWKIQTPSDPATVSLFDATMPCMKTPPLTFDDLKRAPYSTVLRIRIAKGKLAKVAVAASSGNPELDQRALACYEDLPTDFTLDIADEEELIPVVWREFPL